MTFTDTSVSVVVGGATGIGRAVAEALKARPGRVEIAGRRNSIDISDEASVAAYFKQVGPVDHVVVTAGSSAPGGGVTQVDLGAAKAAFDVKFWGSVIVAREAAKHIRPGGTITLTSGFLARRTVPGAFVKTAMNAALEATAKMLAKELAPIRVNIVSPGLTRTEAYSGMDEAAREQMFAGAAERLPAGRVAEAADVAAGYLFVIDNPSVTGAVIDIDGGALIN
ncbi:SDR family oxidoreductase [Phaeovulum vinaykumarii]|uniref:NAD(P)-dependent dehydrogenase, short-chain alcohol dehydrogenase family n=1 Tax=Phaeovulum vinaykumarii TaxID=407234 RepID=A0A1N7N0Q3_9RHOB|nr:SDR family oxidoreductase [Phaeovulum vinaykumarii]SIS91914.1 NAD(P)-dependent dehydrogenase, short-chain alcohol dehydrogenase family [Phaeovulum vinaykumarii]SOC17878.1 NAD(P)-dependent dehydrogenase (short-subunit alcohol dehydrogenase family) [Phaeovulum vinaykumarii]